jgi:hypothetical protein
MKNAAAKVIAASRSRTIGFATCKGLVTVDIRVCCYALKG